ARGGCHARRPSDNDRYLAERWRRAKTMFEILQCPANRLFVSLGNFAHHCARSRIAKRGHHRGERIGETTRSLVENHCARLRAESVERTASRSVARRQKSLERESIGGKTRNRKRCDSSRCARHRSDSDASIQRCTD